jgi:hypothetical protein
MLLVEVQDRRADRTRLIAATTPREIAGLPAGLNVPIDGCCGPG